MFAKGNRERYWVVENTKRCSQFCKDQLKVWVQHILLMIFRKTNTVSCGHSKPRSPLRLGTSSSKSCIAKMAQHIFYASIVTLLSLTRIAMSVKAPQLSESIWGPVPHIAANCILKPANVLQMLIYSTAFSILPPLAIVQLQLVIGSKKGFCESSLLAISPSPLQRMTSSSISWRTHIPISLLQIEERLSSIWKPKPLSQGTTWKQRLASSTPKSVLRWIFGPPVPILHFSVCPPQLAGDLSSRDVTGDQFVLLQIIHFPSWCWS